MTAVGDILKSSDPDRPDLKVLGATENGQWLVTENDEFGSPRTLEPDEFEPYKIDSAPVRVNEDEGWRRIGDSLSRPVIPERPKSPEQLLEAGGGTPVEGDGKPKKWAPVVFTDSAPWLRGGRDV